MFFVVIFVDKQLVLVLCSRHGFHEYKYSIRPLHQYQYLILVFMLVSVQIIDTGVCIDLFQLIVVYCQLFPKCDIPPIILFSMSFS